jgi:uncharacterized protein
MEIFIFIIALILMIPALFFITIPLFPILPYLFTVATIFAFITKFSRLSGWDLGILGFILFLSILTDYFSGVLGAKYGVALKKSAIFGFVGAILGSIIFPPFGGFAGLFLGVVISELVNFKSKWQALKAGTYSILGTLLGMILNAFLAGFFILFFIVLFLLG